MKLLGLPGRKASTLDQMTEVVGEVRLGQTETAVQAYGFWDAPEAPDPDIGPEARIAADSGARLVIAKSIGTLITMQAKIHHGFSPDWCVFIGAPVRRFQALGLADLLAQHCRRTPTLFIQQSADFNGPWAELQALVPDAPCLEIPGDDHLYADTARIVALIEAHRPNA